MQSLWYAVVVVGLMRLKSFAYIKGNGECYRQNEPLLNDLDKCYCFVSKVFISLEGFLLLQSSCFITGNLKEKEAITSKNQSCPSYVSDCTRLFLACFTKLSPNST